EADDRRAGPLGVAEIDDLPRTGENLALRVGDDGLLTGHHVEGVQRKTLFTGDRVVDLVVHDRGGPVVDHARHLVDDFGLQRPGVVPPGPQDDEIVAAGAVAVAGPDLDVPAAGGHAVDPRLGQNVVVEQVGEVLTRAVGVTAVEMRDRAGTRPQRLVLRLVGHG